MADSVVAELFFTTNSKMFQGAYFVSSLIEKGSMWISGSVGRSNQVLWHVNVPDFKVLLEKTIEGLKVSSKTEHTSEGTEYATSQEMLEGKGKGGEVYHSERDKELIKVLLETTIEDSKASSQIIMVSFRKQILFAEKGGREIYGINVHTQSIETMFSDMKFQIDAMCCNDDHMYIFQKKSPDVIQILDSKFQSVGKIPTGFIEGTFCSNCKVDLCTTTTTMRASTEEYSSSGFQIKHQHMCIICVSKPAGMYRSHLYSSTLGAPKYPSVQDTPTYPFVRGCE